MSGLIRSSFRGMCRTRQRLVPCSSRVPASNGREVSQSTSSPPTGPDSLPRWEIHIGFSPSTRASWYCSGSLRRVSAAGRRECNAGWVWTDTSTGPRLRKAASALKSAACGLLTATGTTSRATMSVNHSNRSAAGTPALDIVDHTY